MRERELYKLVIDISRGAQINFNPHGIVVWLYFKSIQSLVDKFNGQIFHVFYIFYNTFVGYNIGLLVSN